MRNGILPGVSETSKFRANRDDAGDRVLGLGAKRMRGTCSSAQVYPESPLTATTPMGNRQLQHFKGIGNRKRTGAYRLGTAVP